MVNIITLVLVIVNCFLPPYHIGESEYSYIFACSSLSSLPQHCQNDHLHQGSHCAMLHHMIQFLSQLWSLEARSFPPLPSGTGKQTSSHSIMLLSLLYHWFLEKLCKEHNTCTKAICLFTPKLAERGR